MSAARMVVRSESDNRPAIRFYESQGFTHLRHVQEVVGLERMTLVQLTATVPARETAERTHALSDATCVFCRILDGEAPASFVYEDDQVVAFMDLYPVTPGHLLVVPREHRPGLADLPPDLAAQIFTVGQELAGALRASNLRTDGFNLFLADGEVAMQEVPHAHLHVIPRFPGDGFRIQTHRHMSTPSRTDLDRQATAIRAGIDRSSA
jgi:diadenosine tetraphosphate (Ap4A) HIT family hydrolase